MIGAPKCSRCPLKHTPNEMCQCIKNKGKIIDGNYYWRVKAFRGLVETDDNTEISGTPAEIVLPTDVCELLRWTTVRCKPSVDLTAGWTVYPNCPPLPSNSRWRRDQKRPRPMFELSRDERRCTRDSSLARTDEAVISDPEIINSVKEALGQLYSPLYKECQLTLRRYPKEGKIYVKLKGAGDRWCTIKGDYHNQSLVYFNIEIVSGPHGQTRAGEIRIYPHCYCKKGKCAEENGKGKWKAWPSSGDAAALFPGFTKSAGSSSRANGLAKQQRR